MNTSKDSWSKILKVDSLRLADDEEPQDITSFLGIAVGGSRKNIIARIIDKGFAPSFFGDEMVLRGQFNGENVNVDIQVNGGKVFRIVVFDAIPRDSIAIRNRYNDLRRQFAASPRYISLADDSLLAEENIEHEMSVKGKVYEATYYQKPDRERVGRLTVSEMTLRKIAGELDGLSEEKIRAEFDKTYVRNMLGAMTKKVVWLTIVRDAPCSYRIAIVYENGYNLDSPDI